MKLARPARTTLFVAALAALGGCGGGEDASDDTSPSPPSPPPVSVTIGGTISGLTGRVTLRNNGADDLVLSVGGTFAFAQPVNAGSNYSVSVATQPAGQTCTVTHGSGTAAGSNVTDVSVTCTGPQANASGSLDTAFGNNGKVTTDFSGAPS